VLDDTSSEIQAEASDIQAVATAVADEGVAVEEGGGGGGGGQYLPTTILFDLADELVVADKSVLIAAGVCPFALLGGAASATSGTVASAGGTHGGARGGNKVLRVCKRTKSIRWVVVDKALKSALLAASNVSAGGGGRNEMGGGVAKEIYGVVGLGKMSFMTYLIVATNVTQVDMCVCEKVCACVCVRVRGCVGFTTYVIVATNATQVDVCVCA